ncbi:MAG TPA: stalk domain-containing protein [Tissierellaceae bacterium]
MKKKSLILIIFIISIILIKYIQIKVLASSEIQINIDGKTIDSSVSPFIENGRTMVPIRVISEELGAKVIWNEKDRTVEIIKGDTAILLRINSRLVELRDKERRFILSDVSPKIVSDRTYVPLRLVSSGLGVVVNWDEKNRTVYINSREKAEIEPFYDIKITSLSNGQTITGKTELQVSLGSEIENAKEIKYLLLDPSNAKGFIIGRGNDITKKYIWLPSLNDNGEKVIVAAVYNENGNFIAGDSVYVNVNIKPEVRLIGPDNYIVTSTASLSADLNFEAYYVKYSMINLDNNKTTLTTEMDPYGTYNWSPMWEDNGNYLLKVIAYDYNGQAFESESVSVKVEVPKKLSLTGVKEGMTIDKPVTLSTSRNFQVSETEYVIIDANTGEEKVLAKMGYGSYKWFPIPEDTGVKKLFVRVKDTRLNTIESEKITVYVDGTPKLILNGIGPNQVVTNDVNLGVISNVNITDVKYIFTNVETGITRILNSGDGTAVFSPTPGDNGIWKITATAKYGDKTLESEEIQFKIYLGKLYSSMPIIEKDKFMGLASDLAKASWEKTGMSAALQTAQAILETGWGQSVPVDKYSGKLSYNLFGIKGKGTAGSVISNTWEEYNGNRYRIDAEFRAYNSVEESWNDHKNLLLTSSRYEPFRDVMFNGNFGAWALKRCGYATDSQYAIKLIDIMRRYNLYELDKLGI